MNTFSALEAALSKTGRRTYAGAVLACLLDAYDQGKTQLEKREIVTLTEIAETNVATVARRLEEQGIIDILYWDTKAPNPVLSSLRNGPWSIPFYRLTPAILALYRRG
ncbi:hypothetical protein BIY27_12120 [Gibbsiella quercinecans]|uniref:hypothetical protein n=1 Tax=Gibbsiella quercinecans TaxID=929813 RepID=UPI000EF1A1B4|nr:hypothetical protein [Gibbsiella quercinecans]RLM11779.1 hypothetical protein BIY27_12120 [Gibbsiella quercinecans]